MNIRDLFVETFSAFNSNRARSLLTVLGVVIGISAVIAMTAIIGGVKAALVGEMGLSQARLVMMSCSYGKGMTVSDVSEMDDALKDSFEVVMPVAYGGADVVSSTEKASAQVMGVGAEYADMNGLKLVQGRYFSQREADAASLAVVLDEAGAKKLFGSASDRAVGQTVRMGGSDYEVIGVLSSTSSGPSESVSVQMPFKTCAQRVTGSLTVNQVMGLAREDVDVQRAADDAKQWLIARYRIPENEQEDALYIVTMKSIIEQLDTLMASFQVLMTVVASISLLVGGIGIMNMMLTNVTERIREIGLRKALGARRRDITRQFLLESILLTLTGGVFGVVLGYLGAFALAGLVGSAFALGEGVSITPVIGLDTVALVAGICVAIGVVFGYYPARRAAKLDPVESLHYQ